MLRIFLLLALLLANARDCAAEGAIYHGTFADQNYGPYSVGLLARIMGDYAGSLNGRREVLTLGEVLRRPESEYGPNARACINMYKDVFVKDKDVIDMRIFFGYKNYIADDSGRIYTQDLHIKMALQETLTRACAAPGVNPSFFSCGFKSTPLLSVDRPKYPGKTVYDNIIQKDFVDGYGRKHTLKITFVHSSLWLAPGISDPRLSTTTVNNPGMSLQNMTAAQAERSRQVDYAFKMALQQADIVYYNGHSRRGGGPDFYPPYAKANGQPYYEYITKHPEVNRSVDIVSVLANSRKKPSIVGVFSCRSEHYFLNDFRRIAPQTNFILNVQYRDPTGEKEPEASFWVDEPAPLLGSINALLGGFCMQSFNGAMQLYGMDRRSTFGVFTPQYTTPDVTGPQPNRTIAPNTMPAPVREPLFLPNSRPPQSTPAPAPARPETRRPAPQRPRPSRRDDRREEPVPGPFAAPRNDDRDDRNNNDDNNSDGFLGGVLGWIGDHAPGGAAEDDRRGSSAPADCHSDPYNPNCGR